MLTEANRDKLFKMLGEAEFVGHSIDILSADILSRQVSNKAEI